MQFQSLNRSYKRSDAESLRPRLKPGQFQSLNRAYKRSDNQFSSVLWLLSRVSIPQSGLQAFRLLAMSLPACSKLRFQSLNRAYKRSDPASYPSAPNDYKKFQSLNRAYKRSDGALVNPRGTTGHVSIPQSGLQAFRLWDS